MLDTENKIMNRMREYSCSRHTWDEADNKHINKYTHIYTQNIRGDKCTEKIRECKKIERRQE